MTVLLKLGGSLITEKSQAETARIPMIHRLAEEITQARQDDPNLTLVLGHGSGSFGHQAAGRYHTHQGAQSEADWRGFAEVWASANRLNRLVIDALRDAGLPAIGFPPSATAICQGGELLQIGDEPIRIALDHGLIPVVHGDVAIDRAQGAAIVSTEQVLVALAPRLGARRLLLAGREPGVYEDFADKAELLAELGPDELATAGLGESAETDVTGGMAAKVRLAMDALRAQPGLEVRIFSAEAPDSLYRALMGEAVGTHIHL